LNLLHLIFDFTGTYQCAKANYEIILCPSGSGGGSSTINWNGNNWAMSCDFRGNDLSNVRVSGELCGGKCAESQGCTHFTWTQYLGGTCWLKTGSVSKNDAFSTNDPNTMCGVRGTQKRQKSKRIHLNDIFKYIN
jgi:hypothetical protein